MITKTLTPEEYHALHKNEPLLLTASRLKRLKNPYREHWGKPAEATPEMNLGSLVDCLWLTPELFDRQFKVMPEDAPRKPSITQINAKNPSADTVKAIIWWKAFEQACMGKTIIDKELFDQAMGLVTMLNEHPDSMRIRDISETQVTAVCEHQFFTSGPRYRCKALCDLIPDERSEYGDAIVDLKVTALIEDDEIARVIENMDYHVRAAHYLNTWNAALDDRDSAYSLERQRYILLNIHPETGEIKLAQIDERDLEDAWDTMRERVMALERFVDAGRPRHRWNTGVRIIQRPAWAHALSVRKYIEPSTDDDL